MIKSKFSRFVLVMYLAEVIIISTLTLIFSPDLLGYAIKLDISLGGILVGVRVIWWLLEKLDPWIQKGKD